MSNTNENPANARTVELISKRLKAHQVVAVLLMVTGGVWMYSSAELGEPSATGALFLFVGMLWWLVTRVRIWWHHK